MRGVYIAVTCLALASPAFPQDKATIQRLNDAFSDAFNKGDYASVAAIYSEDAYLLPPGAEMIRGRGNIQSFWTKAGEGLADPKVTTVEVLPLGDGAAREIGNFTLKTKGQPSMEIVGKYVVIWQKFGSDWKIATDIWNANK
jgi:uncharacterized protein (TIGR02246 family)